MIWKEASFVAPRGFQQGISLIVAFYHWHYSSPELILSNVHLIHSFHPF